MDTAILRMDGPCSQHLMGVKACLLVDQAKRIFFRCSNLWRLRTKDRPQIRNDHSAKAGEGGARGVCVWRSKALTQTNK